MACTVITFQARSALRDVAAALDLPVELLQQAHQALEAERMPAGGTLSLVAELCRQIDGLPRHLGQRSGGMVLTGAPLAERVPIERAAMPGRVVVQWDKDALEEAGLVKVDLLGLRMLSALSEAVKLVGEATGSMPDLDRLSFDDGAVFDLIARADTVGVFQVESRAQAHILPRLKPRCMGDLIVAISLIRPGPLQGDMVHPYLRRRQRLEPISYKHPLLKTALEETLGVILFQEQVLKVARDLAGSRLARASSCAERWGRSAPSRRSGSCTTRSWPACRPGASRQGWPMQSSSSCGRSAATRFPRATRLPLR